MIHLSMQSIQNLCFYWPCVSAYLSSPLLGVTYFHRYVSVPLQKANHINKMTFRVTSDTSVRLLLEVLGSPVHERHWHAGASPAESYEAAYGVGAYDIWGKNWDCSALKKEDKRGQILLLSSNISNMGGSREDGCRLFSEVPSGRTRGQWTQVGTRENLTSCETIFFYCKGDRLWNQGPERLWTLYQWRY